MREDIEVRLVTRLVFGMINSIVEWYRPDGRGMNEREVADAVAQLAFSGLRRAGDGRGLENTPAGKPVGGGRPDAYARCRWRCPSGSCRTTGTRSWFGVRRGRTSGSPPGPPDRRCRTTWCTRWWRPCWDRRRLLGRDGRGATFQGFELVTRDGTAGLKVLRRGGDAVMAAELRVNWAYRAWRGLSTEGRGVGRAPLDAEALARTGPRLDAAARRWAAVPVGGELLWRWGVDS
ncbi:hypothetical protein SALBM217S_04036 [Streptomyces griseoloalbus]